MSDKRSAIDKSLDRRVSNEARLFFLPGLIWLVLCWEFWLPRWLLAGAGVAAALALILALLSWRQFPSKIIIIGVAGFCWLSFSLGWDGLPTRQAKVVPTAAWMKPLESPWVLQSPGKSHSIGASAEVRRNGEDSLRFELRGGEAWVDQTFIRTFRAEVATREFVPANSVKWYAFSVYFPTNFPIEDRWLCFAQWKTRESLWDGVRRKGQRPALRFGFANGRFDVVEIHNSEGAADDAENRLFKKNHFRLGAWHDFVVQSKWSCQNDGFINIWWNNRQIVNYHGPVGYGGNIGPQFKFGLYHENSGQPYIVYFNAVKSGETAREIDFNPAAATPYAAE